MGGRANGGCRDLHGKALFFFFFPSSFSTSSFGEMPSGFGHAISLSVPWDIGYPGSSYQVLPRSQYGTSGSRLGFWAASKYCRVLHGSSGHAVMSNTGIFRPCDQMDSILLPCLPFSFILSVCLLNHGILDDVRP
jgi:hypothetical protein